MKRLALHASVVTVALALSAGCAPAQAPPPAASAGTEQTILAKSVPGASATVQAPVNKLELWFDPPARLGEVTVTGPQGQMPMMVTAVGEVGYYSLPVSATAPGEYTVAWRASAGGRDHRGSFSFAVR